MKLVECKLFPDEDIIYDCEISATVDSCIGISKVVENEVEIFLASDSARTLYLFICSGIFGFSFDAFSDNLSEVTNEFLSFSKPGTVVTMLDNFLGLILYKLDTSKYLIGTFAMDFQNKFISEKVRYKLFTPFADELLMNFVCGLIFEQNLITDRMLDKNSGDCSVITKAHKNFIKSQRINYYDLKYCLEISMARFSRKKSKPILLTYSIILIYRYEILPPEICHTIFELINPLNSMVKLACDNIVEFMYCAQETSANIICDYTFMIKLLGGYKISKHLDDFEYGLFFFLNRFKRHYIEYGSSIYKEKWISTDEYRKKRLKTE